MSELVIKSRYDNFYYMARDISRNRQTRVNFKPYANMHTLSTEVIDKSAMSLYKSSLGHIVTLCQMSCFYHKMHNHVICCIIILSAVKRIVSIGRCICSHFPL